MRRDDRSTWTPVRPTNLKATKKDPAANAIIGPPLRTALDQLLGPAGWTEPSHQGQVLVTLPTNEPWSIPHRQWHTDVGFNLPQNELVAVKPCALLANLKPGGGTRRSPTNPTDLMTEADLDGIPVRVVELTGQPGDIYLTHPWLLHPIAPNARNTPRIMRTRLIWQTN